MIKNIKHIMAEHGSAWKLPLNDVWNIPMDTGEIRGEMTTSGPWQIIVSYRALAVDCDCRVFGMRRLSHPRQSGYELEGTVSVGGKRYRAFTSSQLFERSDGSLCDVATIYACHDEPFDVPNLDGETDDDLGAFISKYWYANGIRGKLKDYAWQVRMAREARIKGTITLALTCEQQADEVYQTLPEWARW